MQAPKLKLPRTSPTNPKEWAVKLRQRHEAGEHLVECQIRAYKAALGLLEARVRMDVEY